MRHCVGRHGHCISVATQRILWSGRGYPYGCKPSPANPRHIHRCKSSATETALSAVELSPANPRHIPRCKNSATETALFAVELSPANPRHIPRCKNACGSAKSAAVSCEETTAAHGCTVLARRMARCSFADEMAIFPICERTFTRAAGVSPPWLGKRICRYASAKSPESGNGALTNAGAIAIVNPRGANAPRSWLHGVRSPRKWRFLRCTNARSTRSGVCQPAVVGETHLPVRFRKVADDRHRRAHERRCSRGSEPTGG